MKVISAVSVTPMHTFNKLKIKCSPAVIKADN
jgi:hypothetical protein